MKKLVLGGLLGFSLLLGGCGPMNTRPDAVETSGPKANVLNKFVKFTSQGKYFIKSTLVGEKPEFGDNKYQFRLVNAETLKSGGEETKVVVTYGMPEMPEMGTEVVEGKFKEPGLFEIEVFYSMPGLWELSLEISENGVTDVHKVPVTL